ncbi:MAG: flagellar biosynthesis protein FlgH [Desulfobacca sp.]|nr:flagellar biosynthesis protein FlgH [Desulfobacca sp.]
MKIEKYITGLLGIVMTIMMTISCVHTKAEFAKDMPANFVQKEPKKESSSPGSLWRDSAGLFEDRKARGINDLVTINIVESSSASKKADTSTGRDSSMAASIDSILGNSLEYRLENLLGLGNAGISGALAPKIGASTKNFFSGTGNTARAGTLVATITARVLDVLPNGNFLIESRKDITVNKERQLLLLRGVIRPEDIGSDNTILSSQVANAEMIYTGDGVLHDKQGQGWMVRLLDYVWPF